MLNICITADHELFSGDNSTGEEQVVIKPTERLLELLEGHGMPLTLFTDVCSIERYRELVPQDPYPDLMESQLRSAVSNGHDVQLHIHPHWYDSSIREGKWVFDLKRFRLHEWGFDQDDPVNARAIIHKGKEYLENLLKPVDKEYRCVGFRAGGWCLQPERQLLRALLDEGIWIDSTVYIGGYEQNSHCQYDFRQAPDRDSWWASPDQGLLVALEAGPDRVFEITIGSSGTSLFTVLKKCQYKLERRLTKRNPVVRRGYSHDQLSGVRRGLTKRLEDWISQPVQLSYDDACASSMLDIVGHYVRQNIRSGDSFISVIGHPKTLQEDDFKELDRFCMEVRRKFEGSLRFITVRDISKMQMPMY